MENIYNGNKSLNALINKLKIIKIPIDLIVKGTSMYPCLCDGEKVRVYPIRDISDIHIGDIIVYYKFSSHLTIHRVFELCNGKNKELYIKTKGDNNEFVDSYYVTYYEILGKVDK